MSCSKKDAPVRRNATDSTGPAQVFDAGILSGVGCDVSRETRQARNASGLGGRNTMSKGTNTGKFDTEELAGRSLVAPPTVSYVKTVDDAGMNIPRQHMAVHTPTDEKLRTRVTTRANAFRDGAIPVQRKTPNHMWPASYTFHETSDDVSGETRKRVPRDRDEPKSMGR